MGRLLTSLILLIVGAALGAAGMYYFVMQGGGSAGVATISFYGDWRLNCPAPSETDRYCELVQSISDNRTGEIVFRISVRRTKEREEIAIIAPFGILLEPGIGIAFGETTPRKVEIDLCDDAGCRAVLPVDDQMFAAIKTTDAGVAVVTDYTGKLISLPISLKGLGDGLAAMRSRSNVSLLDTIQRNLKALI